MATVQPERTRVALQQAPQLDVTLGTELSTSPSIAWVPDQTDTKKDAEDTSDPMVSGSIHPFTIPVGLEHPHTGKQCRKQALIDTGCTRCLIKWAVVEELGLWEVKLHNPISFEQMDGSILSGRPITHVTQPLWLTVGNHRELIRFVVVSQRSKAVILGLAWLDKWEPTNGYHKDPKEERDYLGSHLGCSKQAVSYCVFGPVTCM